MIISSSRIACIVTAHLSYSHMYTRGISSFMNGVESAVALSDQAVCLLPEVLDLIAAADVIS